VLEFAASLPPDFKVKGRTTKRILKESFQGRVPREILTRRKTGFPVPFGRWLSREMRDFVSDTLFSAKSASRGYFRREGIEGVVAGDGNGALASEMFSLVVLELWHRQFVDQSIGNVQRRIVSVV
jgi:asparagine synthase (glutamine-hydrolysing)